jgi:predicted transcriptional regulator
VPKDFPVELSRRERQIMDVIYRLGSATAAEVQAELPDPPSYSAVRALLRILEEKGLLKHEQDGPRYIFRPTVTIEKAQTSALQHLLRTFFNDSPEQAVAALLDMNDGKLSQAELDRLSRIIDEARSQGR